MNHLSRPLGQRLGVSAAALLMAVGLVFSSSAQTAADYANLEASLTGAKIKKDSAKIKTFGNYNDCMKYEVSIGQHYCPGFFFFIPTGIPYPTPCIDFDYREPTAAVEVTCSGESNVDGRFNLGTIFGGAHQRDTEQKCTTNIKTKGGMYSRSFYDAEVYSVTGPVSRLSTSASPVQVAQTYTCGIFGFAGNMDLLQQLKNFNLDAVLDPSAWSGAAQSAVQNVQTEAGKLNFQSMFDFSSFNVGDMLTNLGESFKSAITGFMTSLQQSFTQIETALKGLMNGTTTVAAASGTVDFGKLAQDFFGAGEAMGAEAAVKGDGNLLNAAVGIYSGGNALQTLSTGKTNPQQSASLAESFQNALNIGAQSLGLGGNQKASADTFYATNFTPANFAATQVSNTVIKSAPGNRPNDAYASWSFTAVGEKVGDTIKPTGFVKDGQSQVALDAVLLSISTTLGWMNGVSDMMVNHGLEAAKSFDAADLCSIQAQLDTSIKSLKEMKKRLNSTTSPSILLPVGTYLNSTQPQVALRDEPVASCPLTHAGFRARLDNPSKLEIVNCTTVCTGGGDSPRICHVVPKAGFAGSCFTNALSVQKLEGEYLACNGYKPSRVANGMGGWTNVGKQYNAELDENGKANQVYVKKMLAAGEHALANLQTAQDGITTLIRSRGGSCSALGNPVGKEFIAYTPLPSSAQVALLDAGGGGGNALTGLEATIFGGGLTTMTGTVDSVISLASMGPDNIVASQVARVDVVGSFPTVFKSDVMKKINDSTIPVRLEDMPLAEQAMANPFAIGKFDFDQLISNSFKALDNTNGLVAEMTGCQLKLYGDIATGNAGYYENQLGSTACWGDIHDGTGWTTQKIPALGQMKVGAVGHEYALTTGAIPKNISGTQMVEIEGTGARSAATTEGLAPLGVVTNGDSPNSKCYPEGTINPAIYTPGGHVVPSANEMLGAAVDSLESEWQGKQTDTDDGSLVMMYWKNTKCCIPPTCPQNIKQEY